VINPLTGHNTSSLRAPRLGLGELWFFKSIYTSQRDYLKELATLHALGELLLAPGEHSALIDDLRSMHSMAKGLAAQIDAIYQPAIDMVMAEPDNRLEPKVIPIRHKVPKRRPGRPPGSKDKHPRKKRKATKATITAPDMSGAVRIEHPNGKVVKRRPKNWPANTGKQAKK
jgi:hypothetical protein